MMKERNLTFLLGIAFGFLIGLVVGISTPAHAQPSIADPNYLQGYPFASPGTSMIPLAPPGMPLDAYLYMEQGRQRDRQAREQFDADYQNMMRDLDTSSLRRQQEILHRGRESEQFYRDIQQRNHMNLDALMGLPPAQLNLDALIK